jgi:hypothetical protein
MTVRHSLAVGIALLAFAGCGGPTAPQTGPPNADETAAAGSYTLVKVDGLVLPTTSAFDAFLCRRGVDSGTLTLLTNPQTYALAVGLRSTCEAGDSTSTISIPSTETEAGIWSLSGGVFTFTHTGGSSMSTDTVTYAVGSITAGVNLLWGGGTPQEKSMLFTK